MLTTQKMKVKSSKNVACTCLRKLCKVVDLPEGKFIHLKHKGSELYTTSGIITCISCGKQYYVSADNGIEKEVTLGRT